MRENLQEEKFLCERMKQNQDSLHRKHLFNLKPKDLNQPLSPQFFQPLED